MRHRLALLVVRTDLRANVRSRSYVVSIELRYRPATCAVWFTAKADCGGIVVSIRVINQRRSVRIRRRPFDENLLLRPPGVVPKINERRLSVAQYELNQCCFVVFPVQADVAKVDVGQLVAIGGTQGVEKP